VVEGLERGREMGEAKPEAEGASFRIRSEL